MSIEESHGLHDLKANVTRHIIAIQQLAFYATAEKFITFITYGWRKRNESWTNAVTK